MKISKTFYAKTRKEWRYWLKKNHNKTKEIWLVYYKKASGKPRVTYNDAVEEALCFGWIDSTVKTLTKDSFCQRFTPRRSNSWSELNKHRVKVLTEKGLMAKAGVIAFEARDKKHLDSKEFKIPSYILKKLKADKKTWENFNNFSETYKRLRIKWIIESRVGEHRKKRLNYFVKMTAKNKKFGTVQV